MTDEQDSFSISDKKEDKKPIVIRIIIEGRVQKVGFRNWMQQLAKQGHVHGWVRNKKNGSVEALLSGKEENVRNIVQQSYVGPPFCSVKRVKEFPQSESVIGIQGFVILPTA